MSKNFIVLQVTGCRSQGVYPLIPHTAYLAPQIVENKGVEPLTPCVQGRCSGQLS
jgi:hypothetical protein